MAIVPNAAGIRSFPRGMAPVNMNINMQRRMPFLGVRVNLNNNQPQPHPIPQPQTQPSVQSQQSQSDENRMDKNARTDYYGEKIYEKIAKDEKFSAYESYFPKIVGIFLDLSDGVIERLLNDDKYFNEQVEETIRLLDKKEKSN